MTIFAALRERLRAAPAPPRCLACRQDMLPLERVGPARWFCPVCAKDFAATSDDGGATWRGDLTPRRYEARARRRGASPPAPPDKGGLTKKSL
jgi:predicted amidophosphoribosyltransferase